MLTKLLKFSLLRKKPNKVYSGEWVAISEVMEKNRSPEA